MRTALHRWGVHLFKTSLYFLGAEDRKESTKCEGETKVEEQLLWDRTYLARGNPLGAFLHNPEWRDLFLGLSSVCNQRLLGRRHSHQQDINPEGEILEVEKRKIFRGYKLQCTKIKWLPYAREWRSDQTQTAIIRYRNPDNRQHIHVLSSPDLRSWECTLIQEVVNLYECSILSLKKLGHTSMQSSSILAQRSVSAATTGSCQRV